MSKVKNFQEEFSLDDIGIARDVMETFNCSRFPICIKAPLETYHITRWMDGKEYASEPVTFRSIKLEYAIRVFSLASAIAAKSSSNLFDLWRGWRWSAKEGGFNNLDYEGFRSSKSFDELCDDFIILLEDIANSGRIYVTEGYYPTNQNEKDAGLGLSWVVVCDEILEWERNHKRCFNGSLVAHPFNTSKITFKWDDIKWMFHKLSINQMRLVQHKYLHNHTELDDELLQACSKWDEEGIKRCMTEGANINCLDQDGESVLQKAVEFFRDKGVSFSTKLTDKEMAIVNQDNLHKCQKIVELLLSYGADINLYGYEGLTPLVCAYYENSVPMTKFLLEHGADPNVNCFLTDIGPWSILKEIKSTILNCLSEGSCVSDATGEVEYYNDNDKEIERLIIEAGGELYHKE